MPTRTAFLPDFRGPPMTTRRHPPGPPTATTCPKQREDTRERTHQTEKRTPLTCPSSSTLHTSSSTHHCSIVARNQSDTHTITASHSRTRPVGGPNVCGSTVGGVEMVHTFPRSLSTNRRPYTYQQIYINTYFLSTIYTAYIRAFLTRFAPERRMKRSRIQ